MNVENPRRLTLRAGEWVEVRSREAIVATLDTNGRLGEMPFMPEMFAYCGKRFRVWKRAHKTCDTVNKTGGRWVSAAVHLEDVRCDGAAHGGCEAACLIFWKEAWLDRVAGPHAAAPSVEIPGVGAGGVHSSGEDRVWAGTRSPGAEDERGPAYICQATMLPQATTLLPWWDVRQYLEDYTSGNASVGQLLSGAIYVCFYSLVQWVGRHSGRLSRALMGGYDRVQTLVGGVPYPRRWGTVPAGNKTPSWPLGLKPGELVQVKSYEEILATLDTRNKNRGLYFDAEEVPYCGNTYRVRSSVTQIIDERTGRMLALRDHNVLLEGVICQARYSDRRMICPRAIFSIWRETWLKRVNDGQPE